MEDQTLPPVGDSPAQIYPPKINIYVAEMSNINVNLLYSLMMLRISKGFTPKEVSFLMGMEENHIRKMEELISIGSDMGAICQFLEALEENSMRGIVFSDNGVGDKFSKYKLIKTIYKEIIDLSMFQIGHEQSETLIFKIFESNPDFIKYQHSEDETMKEVRGILSLMLDGSLFYTPQSPLSIYQRCRSVSGSQGLYPRHIQIILDEMTKKRDYPKLIYKKSKHNGYMYYEKIFKK